LTYLRFLGRILDIRTMFFCRVFKKKAPEEYQESEEY
jgi:hypothetical protein